MLKIDCDVCHAEVTVNMYISNPAIEFQRDGLNDRICYIAKAKGRAIWCSEGTYIMFESGAKCPYCD